MRDIAYLYPHGSWIGFLGSNTTTPRDRERRHTHDLQTLAIGEGEIGSAVQELESDQSGSSIRFEQVIGE